MLLRHRKLIGFGLFGLLVVAAVAVFGIGWYFSGVIYTGGLRVPTKPDPYTAQVVAIDRLDVSIEPLPTDGSGADLRYPGLWGLVAERGYVRMGAVVSNGSSSVERAVVSVTGTVSPGDKARVDRSDFPHDPLAAFGLQYENVDYQSPLGPTPAWLIPGDSSTWAILVHGWRSDRSEALRALPLFTERGMPSLVIDYRNDRGAPPDPSGRYQFGVTEWRDLQAAVEYAVGHGAENVVIAGFSMGGAIAVNFMYQSNQASYVKALVLDSPMMDFGQSVNLGAKERGVPSFITWTAKRLASLRYGVNWGALDYLAKDQGLRVPILLFQGEKDNRVPKSSSDQLAHDRPNLVQYEVFPEAQHVGSWNVNPQRYDLDVREFLDRVLQ